MLSASSYNAAEMGVYADRTYFRTPFASTVYYISVWGHVAYKFSVEVPFVLVLADIKESPVFFC